MKITTPLGIFVGFFALGLIVILIQWMCLCCCCCCPSCCPSKCCQKDENEQYTKCELYWPSIFLILLLLLIIIVSAMGISKAGTFKEGLGDIQCSLSMMLDDVVNGNLTTTGKYFIGVEPLITQITTLNSNVNTVNSSMNSLNTTLSGLGGIFLTMADNVKKLPDGLGTGLAPIIYKGDIGTAGASTPITSVLVDVLGDSTNPGSVVGGLYPTLSSLGTLLNDIKAGSDSFGSQISSFTGQIGAITSDLDKVKTQMRDLDNSLSSSLDLLETPKSMGAMVISVIYGVMLGLSVLALLGVVLMTFCDKYKCRYLMYFSCVILFFLGLLGFLLAVIFSILVPVMFFLCEWLDVTLQSSTFAGNTGKFLTDTGVRNIIGTCLNGGSGDIISAVGGASVGTAINGLKDAMSKINAFNTTERSNNITSNLGQVTDLLLDFHYGRIIDITDMNALFTLNSIATPSGCAPVANDMYVPSTRGKTTAFPLPASLSSVTGISCSLPTFVNSTSCTRANFEANPTTCKGCIDFSDIVNSWYLTTPPNSTTTVTGTALKATLDGRYASGDACVGTWSTTFGNVWDNYYKIKANQYSPILGRWKLITDLTNPASDISQINNAFVSINVTMSSVVNILTTNVDAVTNPKYGMIAGLNCQIIGENLGLVVGSICVSNFNTIYITRLLMGIAAFGILFSMCCIVCSGVRHFKHSERKDRVSPNFMGDKNSFEHTDAAFRP
jgi:hypothetical protein